MDRICVLDRKNVARSARSTVARASWFAAESMRTSSRTAMVVPARRTTRRPLRLLLIGYAAIGRAAQALEAVRALKDEIPSLTLSSSVGGARVWGLLPPPSVLGSRHATRGLSDEALRVVRRLRCVLFPATKPGATVLEGMAAGRPSRGRRRGVSECSRMAHRACPRVRRRDRFDRRYPPRVVGCSLRSTRSRRQAHVRRELHGGAMPSRWWRSSKRRGIFWPRGRRSSI